METYFKDKFDERTAVFYGIAAGYASVANFIFFENLLTTKKKCSIILEQVLHRIDQTRGVPN